MKKGMRRVAEISILQLTALIFMGGRPAGGDIQVRRNQGTSKAKAISFGAGPRKKS